MSLGLISSILVPASNFASSLELATRFALQDTVVKMGITAAARRTSRAVNRCASRASFIVRRSLLRRSVVQPISESLGGLTVCSSVWRSACFGYRRPAVQIRPHRPTTRRQTNRPCSTKDVLSPGTGAVRVRFPPWAPESLTKTPTSSKCLSSRGETKVDPQTLLSGAVKPRLAGRVATENRGLAATLKSIRL